MENEEIEEQDAAEEPAAQESAAEESVAEEEAAANEGENAADGEGGKIAELEAKVAGLNDAYLRKAADFENFRKRVVKEKQEAIEYANQSLLLDIIPILDDFERALKSAGDVPQESPQGGAALLEGIGLIEKRLVSLLENKWGLKRFDSEGAAFDPALHEALMTDTSADVTEPVVAADLQKGYTLKGRVIRAAKVKVTMPASA